MEIANRLGVRQPAVALLQGQFTQQNPAVALCQTQTMVQGRL